MQDVPSGTRVPHIPFRHCVPLVQGLSSSQGVPFCTFVPMHSPLTQCSPIVQGFPSSQDVSSGSCPLPVHTPLWQLSPVVQPLPSLHAVPLGFGGFEHTPVAGSQAPSSWHWSEIVQTTGLLPMQTPLSQASLCVQASPSLQAVPLGAAGLEHSPVDGSQVPATWHWSEAVQTTGFEPTHIPLWQVSVCVQELPSLQAVPLGAAGLEHSPVEESQVPATWH